MFIYKNNQQFGPYEDSFVYEMLQKGECSLNDLAFQKGMAEWRPLGTVIPPNGPMETFILPEGPQAYTSPEDRYKGVGGWLLFLCLSLTIFSPLFTIYNLAFGYNQASPHFEAVPGLLPLFALDGLFSIALMIFSVFAGVYLWTGMPNAVAFAKNFLKAFLAYAFLALLFPFITGLPAPVAAAVFGAAFFQLIRSIVFFAIWNSYLNKSRRVKATYTSAPSPPPTAPPKDLARYKDRWPEHVKDLVGELAKLVEENHGGVNRPRIREIGEELNRCGELELMQEAYCYVSSLGMEFPQNSWDKIGAWQQ
jgi:hypothetical protein